MKVQHKNSLEIFELTHPIPYKNGVYGYLVGMSNKIFFIYSEEHAVDYYDVTEDFNILYE